MMRKGPQDVAHSRFLCEVPSSSPINPFHLSFFSNCSDHRGVSNMQLLIEEPEMGDRYRGQSIAGRMMWLVGGMVLTKTDFEELTENTSYYGPRTKLAGHCLVALHGR
jgi:hypothetical protein